MGWVIFVTALLTAGPAQAGLTVVVALMSNGVALGSALTAVYGVVGAALIRMGLSMLLSRAAQALAGKPKQPDVVNEMLLPDALPVYRFAYGHCVAPGTPAPVRVKGRFIYGCWLLNSRPSAGPFELFMDKREVDATGDPYDFAGGGAEASGAPFAGHLRYWIGRGDQSSPPALITAEAPEHYAATDGWQGRTVIWMRIDAGDNASMRDRWPAAPPEVFVSGRFSRVWDPRDEAQDPDEPDTWAWSANQALCVLDALRTNPLVEYPLDNLLIESFAFAADAADESVAVRGGGTIPRYEVNGLLVFADGAEIEDQVQPLADAGAARFVRIGGRLGLIPAVWREPVAVLDDLLQDRPFEFRRWQPGDRLVTEVTGTYTAPDRFWESAQTPIFDLAGARAEDGRRRRGTYDLGLVTDHRQAQRVVKILGMRARQQREVTGVFPGAAFDLVAGSSARLSLPPPYAGRNGIYEVLTAEPGLDLLGQDGVAMRIGLTLRETSAAVYAWNAETEEQEVALVVFDTAVGQLLPPGAITGLSDASTSLISGDSIIPRIRFEFAPSTSPSTVSYEWESQHSITALWKSEGVIDGAIRDGDGDVFGYMVPVEIGEAYVIRVRAVGAGGRTSDWVSSGSIIASAGSWLAPPPTGVGATGGAGEIEVSFRAPNHFAYRATEVWAAAVDDSGAATLLAGSVFGSANGVLTVIETGLGSSETRYYFARSIDMNGSVSPFSASISATTT